MTRKKLLTLLFAFISYMSAMAAVSLEQAKTKVKDYAKNTLMLDEYELYVNTSNISKVNVLFRDPVSVPSASWVFFLDEQPKANWDHNASIIFISKSSGNVTRTKVSFYPEDLRNWTKDQAQNNSYEGNAATPAHLSFDSNGLLLPNQFAKTTKNCNNAYALIISGGASSTSNYSRYWNDCSLFYQILVDVYGYDRNKIYVLMADGTNSSADLRLSATGGYISSPLDLNGDGTNDIQRSATRENISWAFDQLASRMTSNDNLFVFTTDHGASNGNLCLWGEQMSPSQMLTQMQKLNNYKSISVCMEQCYSGAFVNPLSNMSRLTICTAANATETSCGATYIDPFVYHWAMAVSKKEAADTDNDTNISMLEAFRYAKNANECSEHSQYWSDGCLGERQYLDGPLVETKSLCCTLSSNAIRKATSRITSTTKITRANVDYQTYGDIILKSGFSISDGAKFTAKILACRASNTNGSLRSADIDLEYDNEEYEINPEITDVDDVISETEKISIYPNPTDGILNISVSNGSIDNIIVTDITGNELMNQAVNADQAEIDLSAYNKGLYLVKILTENDSYTKKVVLK